MSAASSPANTHAGLRLSLLFVEDHEATTVIMAKLLRRRGHHVVTAASCAEALSLAGTQKFDFVISDLGLPDGSGNELMRSLRERHSLSGIALSGSDAEEHIQEALASGFVRHFIKPIDIDRLQQALIELASESTRTSPTAE
jgi:CheY-like chemotaxis protein